MNALDITILLILIATATLGMSVGIVRFFFACLSLTLGIYLARLFHVPLGRELCELFRKLSPTVGAAAASFIIFFFATVIIFQVGLGILRMLQTLKMRWLDRLLGGLVALAVGWMAGGFLIKLLMLSTRPVIKAVVAGSFLKPYILLPFQLLAM